MNGKKFRKKPHFCRALCARFNEEHSYSEPFSLRAGENQEGSDKQSPFSLLLRFNQSPYVSLVL